MEQKKKPGPFPLRFETGGVKHLRVERVDATLNKDFGYSDNNGHWRLWLMANGNFTLGTFIQLLDNGTINRVTWHEDETETIFNIK